MPNLKKHNGKKKIHLRSHMNNRHVGKNKSFVEWLEKRTDRIAQQILGYRKDV